MHPRQTELLKVASELIEKLAGKDNKKAPGAPVLWKYTDPDGKEFYLLEKKMTVRSPFSGKTFTSKPVRQSVPAVGKELREEKQAPAAGGGPGSKTTVKKRKASEEWKA